MSNRKDVENHRHEREKNTKVNGKKHHSSKIDVSRERDSKNSSKIRESKIQPDDYDSPFEDLEIIRGMGMDRCKDCENLYPLHLNRCPICNKE